MKIMSVQLTISIMLAGILCIALVMLATLPLWSSAETVARVTCDYLYHQDACKKARELKQRRTENEQ